MRLSDLVDVQLLRKLADANFRASGMPIGIVDATDGSVLVGFGWQDICTMYHRANAITAGRCRESDDTIKQHLTASEPHEYTCKNGLRDIGVAIRAGGDHLATLFLGQFFYEGEAPDRGFFVEQARRFGFDEREYLAALDRVPTFTRAAVDNILEYNTALASVISDLAEGALRRRRAEAEAESLARFPKENPAPVLRLEGGDLRVAYANDAARSALAPLGLAHGAPAPDAIGELARRAAAGPAVVQGELAAGDRVFSVTAVPAGNGVNAYAYDITTRVRAEAALRETEANQRAILNATPESIWLFTTDGVALAGNATALARWGKPPETVLTRSITEFLPGELGRNRLERLREVARTGRPVEFEDERSGMHFAHTFYPVATEGGPITRVAVYSRDTTAQRRSEEALHRYELLGNLTRDIVLFVRREDGRILEANAAAVEAYGYGRDELLALRISDLRAPETTRLTQEQLAAADDRGILFEAAHRRKDGTTFAVEVSSRGSSVAGTRVLVSVIRDVTERKRAEQVLRESEERLREQAELLEHAPVLVRDTTDTIVLWNSGMERLYGWSRSEAIGKTTHELLRTVFPTPLASIHAELERAGRWEGELRHVRRDGTGVFVSSLWVLHRDREGRPRAVIEVSTDITSRRRVEQALERANERLVEADLRKDAFLGMLSHELRNPLAPIRNSTYLLRHATPGSEQARRAQLVIERQTAHLARLVDDLLDVTRIARGKIELRRSRVDLREVVLRAAEDFRLMMEDRGVALRTAFPDAKVWANVDPTRMTQIVGNLLHNAAKFTHRGDEVTVSLEAVGAEARVVVRDTGMGMDPSFLPMLFEPFVQGERTLARTEGGLGLGLALVKGIAELHGGTVRAESAGRGKGSTFLVRLPLAESAVGAPAPTPLVERRTGPRRVLIVDDNADAAETLAEVVRMLGHDAEVVYDGPSAVEAARAHRPDVILCDIGLPGMDGYGVARAVRASGLAGVQLVALSGYAQPEDVRKAIEAGFDTHVAKPTDTAEIERLLR